MDRSNTSLSKKNKAEENEIMFTGLIPVLIAGILFCFLPATSVSAQQNAAVKIDFIRDVQPILKAHCFQCHSGAQKQGGLSIDSLALLVMGGASGTSIVAGNGAKSLLVQRMTGADGKPRMPLGFNALPDSQNATIRAWIDQGAVWQEGNRGKKHWAYIKPQRPKLPKVQNSQWCRNPIDYFILSRLEKEGIKPSPEADKITLLRRLTLDLTGLPPTPKEADAFLADRSPKSYENLVDRLLASPHFGERMALPWLDTARYADSNGFQQDGDTYQYIWRDWVVRAYNSNMPFDQFTIQQLAGDLLPNATDEQKIATGFNRCHLLNGEGGAIPEEQRNVILFDRVDVTATTWLGATLACAQCHDHKYDPFSQRDYYSMMAYFNNVPETGTPPGGGQYRIADPWIYAESTEDKIKLKSIEDSLASAKSKSDSYLKEHASEIETAWKSWAESNLNNPVKPVKIDPWQLAGPFPATSFDAAYDTIFPPEKQLQSLVNGGGNPTPDTLHPTPAFLDVKWVAHPEWADGKVYQLDGENSAFYLYRVIHTERAMPLPLSFGSDDAIKVWVNGKLVVADKASRAALPDQDKVTVTLHEGDNTLLMKIVNGGGIGGFYFKAAEQGIPAEIVQLWKEVSPIIGGGELPTISRPVAAANKIREYYLSILPPAGLKEARVKVAALEKERDAYRMNLPKVMVMSDAKPRKTHILDRGNYEMPRDEVTPDVPSSLIPLPSHTGLPPSLPKNRLGLAEWLVSPENPLTSRVQVNRLWQIFFDKGLVKSSENLGTQSEPPTNPDLLDWLAVEFRESGWDTKRFIKLIVMSSVYRQSSKVKESLRRRDPENKLLARGARFRLPAMMLRDAALTSSGLLNPVIGGKPVYPYQPKGIWDGLAITNERDFTYPQSKGADLYRRSLYTFWRRTVAPSNMFDASVRNTCKVRTSTTSTPLHALTMLNDVTWVEAGRALAEHVMKEAGTDPNARLSEAFRRVCSRRPAPDELRILRRSLDRALSSYRADPKSAAAYLKIGESPRDTSLDLGEHAAYSSVCLAIFNLDEALTRE